MPIEGNYFYEDYTKGAGIRYTINDLIFSGRTKYQEVLIFENQHFGKVLALDGIVQTAVADEFIYHEMLTHVPVFALNDVKKVLIVGGGDGGMLRQVLRHPRIHPTMIDIDGELVELCKEHLAEISQGAFDDPRANCLIGDGFEYLKTTEEIYDLIIVDTTDPIGGPSDVLFSTPFVKACKSHMKPGGVFVIQSGMPDYELERARTLKGVLGGVFDDMRFFVAPVPSYFGGFMAFGWGCDDPNVRRTPHMEIEQRFRKSNIRTKYYTPEIHVSSFSVPQYLLDLFEE